jgi:hypothetical protein
MKADQLAIYCHNQKQRDDIKSMMGLSDWVQDTAEGRGVVNGIKYNLMQANLEFNHDVTGMELELITMQAVNHAYQRFAQWKTGKVFFGHLGFHVQEWPVIEAPLVQEMWTVRHTNPFLLETGRTYHYRIYDTISTIGVLTKFIMRIEAGAKNEDN